MKRFQLLSCVWLASSLFFVGCAGNANDGPKRHQVSGTVSFEGAPLPFGTITFEPDAAKGNNGPQGYAAIKNGSYDTSRSDGKGTVGGSMIVTITGSTHEVVTEGSEGRYLFDAYTEDLELPKENSKRDFTVEVKKSVKKK